MLPIDTLFFILAKIIGVLIQAETWLLITLGIILLAQLRHWYRLARSLTVICLTALLVLAILPLGAVLLQPIEEQHPISPALSQVDGIIILGGGERPKESRYWGQAQLNEGGERFVAGFALAHRFPGARVLFTGGSGSLRGLAGGQATEASLAEQILLGQGLAPERLLLEPNARNTAENAQLSLALAQPTPDETWVLVTSAFHMPRALRSFEQAGWTSLVPYPVDYRTAAFADGIGWNLANNLSILNTAIKETVGQLAYRLSGR